MKLLISSTIRMHHFIFLFLINLLFFFISCKSTTMTSETPIEPDTTSHRFVWELDTILSSSSSFLTNVTIVNKDNIWAVGEIHTDDTDQFDSTGNWIPPYNAIHWDGERWSPTRFLERGSIIVPIRDILIFSEDDIWLAAGSIYHWNGNTATLSYLRDISTTNIVGRLWGNSPDNIYGVGTNGLIIHFDGNRWEELAVPVELPIQDIWGTDNAESGSFEILAVASYGPDNPTETKILKIDGTSVTTVSSEGLPPAISSIWFVPGERYYAVGDGVFYTDRLGDPWQHDEDHPLLYKSEVRGNSLKDVIVAGGFGLLSHYNGSNWHQYRENELPAIFGNYSAVDFQQNLMVAVGWINNNALILKGVRY